MKSAPRSRLANLKAILECFLLGHRWHFFGANAARAERERHFCAGQVFLCFRCGKVRDDFGLPDSVRDRVYHVTIKYRMQKWAEYHGIKLR